LSYGTGFNACYAFLLKRRKDIPFSKYCKLISQFLFNRQNKFF